MVNDPLLTALVSPELRARLVTQALALQPCVGCNRFDCDLALNVIFRLGSPGEIAEYERVNEPKWSTPQRAIINDLKNGTIL